MDALSENMKKGCIYKRLTTGGIVSYECGYTLPPNAPDFSPYKARVICRGLWRATFRPDICLAPSEWGGVVAEQGDRYQCPLATCSCQAGRCYRLSQLSVKGRSAVASVGHFLSRACRSALPLTLILYHIRGQKSMNIL